MKSCPVCQRVFMNDAGYCPEDGAVLRATSMVPLAPDSDPRIGARLCGRYQIRRVVADGGMGRVYEGVDKQTDTRIAVKVLHPEVAQDEVAVARFEREYEISAKLPHDYIVKVLDFQRDEAADTSILVMEFLEGEELRHVLKREKYISPPRLVRMLSQAAIALDHAHSRNFVHRDLKPDNLFLCGTRDGDICKILDFGSVKDMRGGSRKLTMLGTTIGSPYYMSPEQAQGLDTLNARADVFSLAAVAYECLTGTLPFLASTGPAILLAIITKDPPPPTVAGKGAPHAIPPALDDVFEEAFAKNPKIRTQSIGALADAVGRAYGLRGTHLEWAVLPEREISELIAAAPKSPPKPDVEHDPFAGPAIKASPAYPTGSISPAGRGDSLMPAGITRRPKWFAPVVVATFALLLGIIAAVVTMRLSS